MKKMRVKILVCFKCKKNSFIAVIALVLTLQQVIYLSSVNYNPFCNQMRIFPFLLRTTPGNDHRSMHSTCSLAADKKSNQKIISFSIYGDFERDSKLNSRYWKPFIQTLGTVPSLYPGWRVRVYHNFNQSEMWELAKKTFSSMEYVDLCNATAVIQEWKLGKIFPMTWRFLPLMDDLVDIIISRDSDSPILQREVDAVQEWLESNSTFHAMRDNPYHCIGLTLLGGLWGAKVHQQRAEIARASLQMMYQDHWDHKGCDQGLMEQFLLPVFKQNMMSHDSYCCGFFPLTQPFPTRRIGGSYVGMINHEFRENPSDYNKFYTCPLACRPKYGLDWDTC